MKPKIHAFCDAGCKWETVHIDDFRQSASIVEIPLNGATEYELTIGKKYRFIPTDDIDYTDTTGTGVLIVKCNYGESGWTANVFDSSFDKFRKVHTVEVIGALINSSGSLEIAYECDGIRKVVDYSNDIGGATSVDELTFTFTLLYVKQLWLFNSDAVIKTEGVPEVTEAENGKILTVENGGMVWKENSADGGALYLHNVQISTGLPYNIVIDIYTTTAEPITHYQALLEILGSGTYHSATYNGSEGHGNGYMMLSQSGNLSFYGILRSSYDESIYTEEFTSLPIDRIDDIVRQV